MSAPLLSDSLPSWLAWLEQLHPSEIELGLLRVGRVADRLSIRPASMPVILVGGTNGKGSTVALLAEIYQHAGYRVGAYTSPHIDVFNERMCIDSNMLDDQSIVDALHRVESVRKPESLTYFEYTTLAAMVAFERAKCDVVLLEVGLGGRLDATNLWDCDCAILTSIALDHQEYLGDTIEAIAAEKVAIGRPEKPLIIGEPNPPQNLLSIAQEQNMSVVHINEADLPTSALAGAHQQRNAACALEAVAALQTQLPVKPSAIQAGLASVHVAGRFERLHINNQLVVLDVAHNPAAAITVRNALQSHYPNHRVLVVFSALKDKDIAGIVAALAPAVSSWFCAGLPVPRATPLVSLVSQVEDCQKAPVQGFATVADAWLAASAAASEGSSAQPAMILIAGSFYTLAQMRGIASAAESASVSVNQLMSVIDPLDEQKAVRLRQRLWGAAVLIALLVIFLPLLLDGSGSESQYRRVESLRAEPPRVLDADGIPEPVEPVEMVVKQPVEAASEPEGLMDRLKAIDTRSPETPDVPAVALVSPSDSPAVAVPEPPATPTTPTTTKTVEPLTAWVVQAGSFSDESNAVAVRDKLRRAGFPSFVTLANDATTPLYRVRVGPMINLQQAEASRNKVMRLLDREAIVVSYP